MRSTTLLRVFLWTVAALACSQAEVRFKVPLPEPKVGNGTRTSRIAPPVEFGAGHLLVQFDEAPTEGQREELKARGARLVSEVPDNALLIATDRELDLSGLDAVSAEPMDPAVKISPLIGGDAGDDFVIEFHPDVDMNAARRLVLGLGWSLLENPDIGPHRLLARRRLRARAADPLNRLASQDEVAYVFPASEELVRGIPVIPCASAVTEAGMLGQYIATVGNGWDGPGLGAAALHYVWGPATSRLPLDLGRSEIVRAMQEWSRVASISWAPGTSAGGAKTVHVLFGSGPHGDPYPFDGRGGVLAHTFYPSAPNPEPIAGDMHLDDSEGWRVGANVDLYSVALHELGHALGLGHSDDPRAVMYPYYRMATTLQEDDRKAVLRLYAAALTTTPSVPAPAPNPVPSPAPPTPTPPSTPSNDRTAPTLAILNPSNASLISTAASRTISGTAYDAGGLKSITWENSLGGSGVASGLGNWNATVPLIRGINRITIRATDVSGNYSWRTILITRP